METFTTQFEMKKMLTYVTVDDIGNNNFYCIINMPNTSTITKSLAAVLDYDIIIKRTAPGQWETVGEPKTFLSQHDILNLGNAIVGDKTVELFGSENY